MGRFLSVIASAVLVVCVVLINSPVVAQQTELPSDEELRVEQRRLAQALFDDPANLQLMFAHANVSIRLRDYEAAITTLERLLIFEQDLGRVRVELGAAYFNLGSYEVSRLYFQQAQNDAGLDEPMRERIAAYLAEIDRRTGENRFEFVANLGLTYATNASLGPTEDTVTIGGIPGFILSPQGRSVDDFGVRMLITGGHSYDLGGPNDDAWITNFALFGVRYFSVEQGNTLSLRLRTGPRLNLTDQAGGARIRPYGEFGYLNGGDETIYVAGFGGAELTAPINDEWTGFADFSAGFLDYSRARPGQDRVAIRGAAGVIYSPSRALVGRASGLFEFYDADQRFNSSTEFGLRLSGEYRYDIGLEFVNSLWVLSAYADARFRDYKAADLFIDPNTTREEYDFRGGIGHLFAISDGFGVKMDVEGFLREANIQNFDLNNLSLTLSAQYRF